MRLNAPACIVQCPVEGIALPAVLFARQNLEVPWEVQAADVWVVERYDVVNLLQDARLSRQPFGLIIGSDHRRYLIVGQPHWASLDLKSLPTTE